MDELKIIFWIILGLIYLFARRKKAEPPPRRNRPVEETREEVPQQPMPKSFEELLREIQQMKEPTREYAPTARNERTLKPQPEVIDYDDDLEDEQKGLEEPYDYQKQDKVYQAYEEAKAQAFNRPSLEETVKLEDTVVRFKQFKGYEKEARRNIGLEVLKELKDPQGFKKAFIMTEILQRKF